MKTRFFKSLLALMLSFVALPMMGEDFVTIYFHNGTHKKLFLKEVKEISVSKNDIDNIPHDYYQTQLIETKNGFYLQEISQIDSVVFSREEMCFPITEEKIEETIDRSHYIAIRTNEIVDSMKANGINSPFQYAQEFMKMPDVIDVEINDNNSCITILRSDSIYHDFILDYWSLDFFNNAKKRISNTDNPSFSLSSRFIPHDVSHILSHESNENVIIKEIKEVLILAPFEELYSNYYLDDFCESIRKNLKVEPHLFKGELADISKFKGRFLDNFDLIIFMTHGQRSERGTGLCSGSSMYKSKTYWKDALKKGELPELRLGTPEGYKNDFLIMTPKFLDEANFKNSFILSFACSSADRANATPSLMTTFLNKGAAYYCGFSNTSNASVVSQFGQKGGQLSFLGMSLQDAYDYLKNQELVQDVNKKWLNYKVYFDENASQEDVNSFSLSLFDFEAKAKHCYMKTPYPHTLNATKNIRSVNLSWSSDLSEEELSFMYPDFELWDFAYSKLKFKIRYDVYLNGNQIASNLYDKQMLWEIDTYGDNNWYIIAKVLNSSTDEVIATYKSDEAMFTIDGANLQLSETTLTMETNGTAEVAITSGSGSYTVANSNEEVAVAAISNGNKVVIAARKAGTATITVTDTKTLQTAEITVTVTASTPAEETLLETNVEGVGYRIYKRNIDKKNVRANADGHEFYKTQMALDVTKNGQKQTYVVDNAIYLDVPEKHHEGQYPCAMFDLGKKQLTIFCNSKSEDENYGMDGNLYTTSLNNIKFTKETVFTEANFGWYPFFKRFDTGETGLVHFSFAGYFNIWSERGDDGEWKLYYYQEYISPEDAQAQAKQEGNVLVIEDGNNPSGAHEAVDLGLPSGTLWATCNVGATKPEEYGHYFAWGETKGYTSDTSDGRSFDVENYKWWLKGSLRSFTKYTDRDGKTELDLEDDAAYVNWGSSWRMPSPDQIQELIDNCNWEWSKLNGVYGQKATSKKNGKFIFFPAADMREDENLNASLGFFGYYWSRTLKTDYYDASCLHFTYYNFIGSAWRERRTRGMSVRPVRMSSNNSKREAIANKRYSWKGKQLENNH